MCVCVEVKEGQEDMGHFSRSSLGPGVKGHEKGTIISLRHFLTRIPPGLSTAIHRLQAFGQLIKFFCLILAQMRSICQGGQREQYLTLLTTKNCKSQHTGERLVLSTLPVAELPVSEQVTTLEVHLAQGQLRAQPVRTLHKLFLVPGLQFRVIFHALIYTLRERD